MLTDAELVGMRATMSEALPDTCTIQRKTIASDGGGGTSATWATHVADVACRLSPVAGGETGTAGGRIADEATAVVTVSAGIDVVEGDRLVIDGQTFDIHLVRERGAWELSTRLEVREAP
jgi:hypothetical protein